MNEGDATWTLGLLIGLPVLVLITLVFVAVGTGLLVWWSANRHSCDSGIALALGLASYAVALCLVVGTAIGFYPWKAEYHQYVTKVGEVESIKARLLGSSGSFQQKFVARFVDGRELACDDTRCALVKPGDTLILACKRTWQYAGVDGYDCRFVASKRPA